MHLRRIPEIEPLGERSRARIERAVFDALDRGAASAVREVPRPLIGPLGRFAERHRFFFARGPVTGRARQWPALGAWAALAVAAVVAIVLTTHRAEDAGRSAAPARIVTDESGARLSVGPNVLEVAPRSALLVTGTPDGEILVVLERGASRFEVAPRRGRPPFAVQAGDTRVEVVGTRFEVSREGDSARVRVEEGVVRVAAPGGSRTLSAGEAWPPDEPAATRPASAAAGEAQTVPVTRRDDSPRELTGTDPTSTPRVARPRREPARAEREPESSVPPAHEGIGSPVRGDEPAARAAPVPVPSSRERFESAAALERRDPDRALALYRELAAGSDAWAANALYAQARLELELGRRAAAKRLLAEYLRRFPRGPNAEDARELLAR